MRLLIVKFLETAIKHESDLENSVCFRIKNSVTTNLMWENSELKTQFLRTITWDCCGPFT